MVSPCKEGMQCPVLKGMEDGACDVKARLNRRYLSLMNFNLASWNLLCQFCMVFLRLATGSGKSLCMFLAPLASSGSAMAVIVSPLNGLMDEQVSLCKRLHVHWGD